MRDFEAFLATAELHKGGADVVRSLLPKVKSAQALIKVSDDRALSAMCLRIFQAGLKHAMVAQRWPAFELHFKQFDPHYCAMLSDEAIEACLANTALIRHIGKLKAIRVNAMMVLDKQASEGSFMRWLASWPTEDIVGLWGALKKEGAQLGGQSGARFLRAIGKDTFLLTDDVNAVLKVEGVVHKVPTAKRDLLVVQEAFNRLRQQSGWPLAHISRVLSMNTQAAL